jgi:hypothetical protein
MPGIRALEKEAGSVLKGLLKKMRAARGKKERGGKKDKKGKKDSKQKQKGGKDRKSKKRA